ncbi:DinB family protein [Formosa sp. 3Alg 14/1]|uniref:DinB family protein n=1 Tax=Formosa sp. 3Alg 14/1 TaxID=3382190 RepID=UPI0039BEACC5
MSIAAQTDSKLPYYEIPEHSETYTAGTVVGRAIDGLGFRFYWATEGLSATDLDFKLNTEMRSPLELMTHIHGLSAILRDAALKVPHVNETLKRPLTYNELRAQTLNNLKTASDILKEANDLKPFDMIFKSPKGERSVPFWNAINGPIEDSVWHCGQIVTIRRMSGNPINPNINHFSGTVRE